MRADAARIQQKRISHKIAFCKHLPFGIRGVAMEEALIDGVVHDFNAGTRDAKQFLDITFGVLRNRQNFCRSLQYATREMKMQRAPQARTVMSAIHVLQNVVYSHHVRTWQTSRHPE